MADKKITELTALTAPDSADVLAIVDVSPSGETKKSTVAQLNAVLVHQTLSGAGTNNHSQIDSFIASKAQASGVASLDGSTKVVQDPANATVTPTASKIPIADGSGKIDGWVSNASITVSGKVELAIDTEVSTGTDATRAVSPDSLAGSNIFGRKGFSIIAVASGTDVSPDDGKAYFVIPECMNGMNLVRANACVNTAGTTNATTIDIYNVTDSHDMLSSAISIASGGTVGTAGTVNTTYDDVATNDILRIDVTTASTTNAKGLMVVLEFQLP